MQVDEILDRTRFQNGKFKIRPKKFNVGFFFVEIENLYRFLLKSRNILLIIKSIPKDLEIFNDSGRLKQIVANMMSNALKFTENGFIMITVVMYDTCLGIVI